MSQRKSGLRRESVRHRIGKAIGAVGALGITLGIVLPAAAGGDDLTVAQPPPSVTVSNRAELEETGVWDSVPVHQATIHRDATSSPRGTGGCPPEVVTHTDASFTGGSYVVQAGFAESEIAAASFVVPAAHFPLQINIMEMIFAQNHFNSTVTQWSVLIWQGQPNTGTLVGSFSSDDVILPHLRLPLMGSNGANIQVQVDPGDPEQIIISDSGNHTFSVGYRIDHHNNQTQNPCFTAPPANSNAFPTTDTSGLAQPSRNWLYGVNCGPFGCPANGGWSTFAALPGFCRPSGDWVLRVTYTPLDCVGFGACCLGGGECDPLEETDCTSQGGEWQGEGTGCFPNPCPLPGACCDDVSGVCNDDVLNTECTGRWVGGATCAQLGNPGVDPTSCGSGACCASPQAFPPNGCIENVTEGVCGGAGGVFHLGDSCAESTCAATGACCFLPSGCANLTEYSCFTAGGFWHGPGTTCGTTVCFPSGACCFPDGSCGEDMSPEDCDTAGGTFQGDSVTCAAANCPQPNGACCLSNGNCLELLQADCSQIPGASWAGPLTHCPQDCEAAEAELVAARSCAYHCATPGCQTNLLCLEATGAPGSTINLPVEPRQFNLSTGQVRLRFDLNNPPSGAVQVHASCTDGSNRDVTATAVDADTVQAVFGPPPLPDTECCTITLSGGATGTAVVRMLYGDVTQNGAVNSADRSVVSAEIGTFANTSPVFWYDVSHDNAINAADRNLVRAEIGKGQDPGCP